MNHCRINLLWALGMVAMSLAAPAEAQKSKPMEASLTSSTTQLVRGQTNKLKAFGDDLPLLGVEIMPAEGVSIGEMKGDVADENEINPAWAKKTKYWSVSVGVDPTAALGERTVVLITPKGRSKPEKIQIVTHRPRITDLKVITARRKDGTIEVTFLASDESEDLGSEPPIGWHLLCGYTASFNYNPAHSNAKVIQYEQADARSGTIHATLSLRGRPAANTCDLQLHIMDKGQATSNELKATVDWK